MENRVAEDLQAKRFCKYFAGTLLTLLSLLLATHWAVDPYENFGTGWMEPLTSSVRREKTESLAKLPEPPSVLILGSSRVMKMEPRYVDKKTGRRTFNLGVSSAMAEDYYVLLKYALSRNVPVEMILLGIDDETFRNGRDVDARLRKNPELAQFLDPSSPARGTLESITQAVSYRGLLDTIDCLRLNLVGFPPSNSSFDPASGFITYVKWESQIADGTFDLDSNIQSTKRTYLKRYDGFNELADWRKEYFRKFVDLCAENDVELCCFMTPLHPEVQEVLAKESPLAQRRAEVVAFLNSFRGRRGFRFVDTSELASFGGDPQAYYDGAHAKESNMRLVADAALEARDSGNQHAL